MQIDLFNSLPSPLQCLYSVSLKQHGHEILKVKCVAALVQDVVSYVMREVPEISKELVFLWHSGYVFPLKESE